MKKKIGISIGIIAVVFVLCFIARNFAIAFRGTADFGGEALLLLIPLIVWIVYKNICLMKLEKEDYKLSIEVKQEKYIKYPDEDNSIQIISFNS